MSFRSRIEKRDRYRARALLIAALALLLVAALFQPAAAASRDVRVALQELRPSIFTNDLGAPDGLFADLVKDIAAREGWNVIWVHGTLQENWDRLSSGQIDLMPGVVATPDRNKLYDFTQETALSAWAQVYAPRGSGISTILDLDRKRVVLLKGDVNAAVFRDYAEKFNIHPIYFEKDVLDEIFTTVAAGDADATVAFSIAGRESADKAGLAETPVMFNPTSLGFAVKKGTDKDLLEAIDRYLEEGKGDPSSRYSQSLQKWFGMKASWTVPPYIFWGLLVAIGLVVLFVVMSVILRQQVRKKTAELVQQNEELHAAYQQLASIEEELRENYQELGKNETALLHARKKLNLLNTLATQEIRSGLFSLRGYIRLAQDAVGSEPAGSYLAKGMRNLGAVEKTLDFVRDYQDMGINPPRWQDVNYAFLNAVSHLDLSKLSRTVQLDGLEVYADPFLEKVFFCLADNVGKHAPSATAITLSYQKKPDGLIITVEDDGPGIPAGDKERIFEKGSSGLGLFLVREILSITGMTIRETGTFMSGARFEIFVPDGVYRFTKK